MLTPYRSSLADLSWPAFPGPGASQKLAVLFNIELSQWRPAEEIARNQFEQATRILEFAAKTVPHYRTSLGSSFDARSFATNAWLELPLLTRKNVQAAGDGLLSSQIPAAHGRMHEILTSGSTGQPVRVMGTDLGRLLWQVFCLREHIWHRRDFRQKLVSIRYRRGSEQQRRERLRSAGWGYATDDIMQTGPSLVLDIRQDIPWLVESLLAEQPGYLLTHPSVMLGLADYCLDNGICIPGLIEARTLGESAAESLRDTCRAAWGVPVVDMYTCQEAGYLALQCPDHEHLHVQSENVLLEVVDAAGRPCRPGEIGRVLITSLNNFATPLIRYEIGDYAEVGEPCSCGRGLPVLRRVMGRYRNLVTLPDGTQRWPLMGFEERLRKIAPVELMQMVQTSLEEIQVRLVVARPLDAAEQEALTSYIQGNLGYPFRLGFEYVDSIRNPANGKVEHFISRLDRAAG